MSPSSVRIGCQPSLKLLLGAALQESLDRADDVHSGGANREFNSSEDFSRMERSCADKENFSSVFSPIISPKGGVVTVGGGDDNTELAVAELPFKEESFGSSEEEITEDYWHPKEAA